MLYKKLLIKLFPYFAMTSIIYAKDNNYLKKNMITNNLPNIKINNNIASIGYSNLFKLNKLDLTLNTSNNYYSSSNKFYNLVSNFNIAYKINNKLSILIDKGINNRLTNFLANFKLIANNLSFQMGYTLKKGIHFGLTNSTDNEVIDEFTNNLAVNLNERVYEYNYDGDIDTVFASEQSTLVFDGYFEDGSTFKDDEISIELIDERDENVINELENEIIDLDIQEVENLQNVELNSCLRPFIETVIKIAKRDDYNNSYVHYYRVQEVTVRPIARVETTVRSLQNIEGLANSESYITTIIRNNINNVNTDEYININSKIYKVLNRVIQPVLSLTVVVKELNAEVDLLQHDDLIIYTANVIKKFDNNEFKDIMVHLYDKLRSGFLESLFTTENIERYFSVLKTFVEQEFFDGLSIGLRGFPLLRNSSNTEISTCYSLNRDSSFGNY